MKKKDFNRTLYAIAYEPNQLWVDENERILIFLDYKSAKFEFDKEVKPMDSNSKIIKVILKKQRG